jgi:pyruvate-ferredoxin/flavodoxin oxidoreductase
VASLAAYSNAFARARIGTPRKTELSVRAANPDPAEPERPLDLAQHTVRQRWQIYAEMATRRAGDFPADAREDR